MTQPTSPPAPEPTSSQPTGAPHDGPTPTVTSNSKLTAVLEGLPPLDHCGRASSFILDYDNGRAVYGLFPQSGVVFVMFGGSRLTFPHPI
jgi:hypothetical protein